MLSTLALLLADAPAAAQPQQGGGFPLIMMVGMVGLMYFVMIRPQQKKMKEQQAMIAAIKTGDKVVISGAIHGVVTNVKDTTFTVRVSDTTKLEVERSAITAAPGVKVDTAATPAEPAKA